LQGANVQKTPAGPALAGQVQSATSDGNFINVSCFLLSTRSSANPQFCSGKTLTNGKQVKGGSCNPIPIGDIPNTQNMVTAVFESPVS
jgi:hypothetical protein